MALGVGDFISFLFDVVYGFVVVVCFTKRTLTCEQDLHWGLGWGGSREVARSFVIHGEFASRLNERE